LGEINLFILILRLDQLVENSWKWS